MLRLSFGLLLPAVASATFNPFLFKSAGASGHECPGKTSSCMDDQTCCPFGGGSDYGCCHTTNVPSSTCCGEGCCSDFETCCSDDKGSACCMQQSTYCIAKSGESSLPARCCPRWTIGCFTGSVGCCDPATPWQWTISAEATSVEATPVARTNTFVGSEDTATAYALITSGWASAGSSLFALTIDTASGNITNKVAVTDFRDDPAGESTRIFLWDSKRKLFYYLDANFTANGGARPAAGRDAFFYTVDPKTGKSTQTTITGAKDFPTGYTMDGTGNIVFATMNFDEASSDTNGFSFYSMDPLTATAKFLGSNSRGKNETDPAFYSGYHRAVSSDGKQVYRLGYEQVTKQINQGVSVTTLQKGAPTVWKFEPSAGHDFFMSLDKFVGPKGDDMFASLAPSRNSTSKSFDVVVWNLDESVYEIAATLSNAHPPRIPGGGDLGYVAATVSGTTFGALVVEYGSQPFDVGDRWGIAMVDLITKTSSLLPLNPRDIAGTWAVSGLGF